MSVGEDTTEGREHRARAAQLRLEAVGPRIYPVLICPTCFSLTGWLSETGSCDSCLRRAQTRAAYSNPNGGFVSLDDMRPAPRDPAPQRKRGPKHILHGRGAHEREAVDNWLTSVDPDTTGPISPEEGFEIEVAHRDQIEAADRTTMLIGFRTGTRRFSGTRWIDLETTRIGSGRLVLPTEYSAGLPTEQIVEAWLDYKVATREFNQEFWLEESARRETRRLAGLAHEETIRAQRNTLDLLDEAP